MSDRRKFLYRAGSLAAGLMMAPAVLPSVKASEKSGTTLKAKRLAAGAILHLSASLAHP